MSALPLARLGFVRHLGMFALELAALATLVFVGLQAGAYFDSTMLGLIAAGTVALVGIAFWSSGGGERRRRHS